VTDEPLSRRRAVALLSGTAAVGWASRLAAQVAQGAQQAPPLPDSLLGRLMDPAAGGSQKAVTRYENDPFIVGIEQKIRCTCGCNLSVYTCRTTDFTCTTSPKMHERVVALAKQGMTAQQILDAFVAQYGQSVLMSPPKTGFNLLGYLVPGSLITVVGVSLTWVLVRRTHRRTAMAGSPDTDVETPDADSTLPPDDAARLRAELEKLEL
jgi:cytochrome c-type biogenesis protein CcmH/NrfF